MEINYTCDWILILQDFGTKLATMKTDEAKGEDVYVWNKRAPLFCN